jgi:hypothetical protein
VNLAPAAGLVANPGAVLPVPFAEGGPDFIGIGPQPLPASGSFAADRTLEEVVSVAARAPFTGLGELVLRPIEPPLVADGDQEMTPAVQGPAPAPDAGGDPGEVGRGLVTLDAGDAGGVGTFLSLRRLKSGSGARPEAARRAGRFVAGVDETPVAALPAQQVSETESGPGGFPGVDDAALPAVQEAVWGAWWLAGLGSAGLAGLCRRSSRQRPALPKGEPPA